jgi:tetratricopeptide (TPR) repeat protein
MASPHPLPSIVSASLHQFDASLRQLVGRRVELFGLTGAVLDGKYGKVLRVEADATGPFFVIELEGNEAGPPVSVPPNHVREAGRRDGARQCHHCRAAEGTKKCSRCRSAWYCSVVCQKAAWKAHKATCKKAPKVAAGKPGNDADAQLAHMQAANAAGAAGNEDQAINMLRRAIKEDPHQPGSHYNLAISYCNKGLLTDALRSTFTCVDLLLQIASHGAGANEVVADGSTAPWDEYNPCGQQPMVTTDGGEDGGEDEEADMMVKFESAILDFAARANGAGLLDQCIQGKAGKDLEPVLATANKLVKMVVARIAKSGATGGSGGGGETTYVADERGGRGRDAFPWKVYLTRLLHICGNVYRKMSLFDKALEALTAANETAGSEGVERLDSLTMIPDVIVNKAMSDPSRPREEQESLMVAAVAAARGAVEAVAAEQPENKESRHHAQLTLARVLYNKGALLQVRREAEGVVEHRVYEVVGVLSRVL